MKWKIGVYPGSFNPFHAGHLELVNKLINERIVDEIFIAPSPNYWDKQNLPNMYIRGRQIQDILYQTGSNWHRKIHVRAIDETATYDVLNIIKEENEVFNPKGMDVEYYLIMGADTVNRFNEWKYYNKIIKDYNIIVVGRGEKPNLDVFNGKAQFVDFNHPASSTEVRERLAKGETEIYGIKYNDTFEDSIKA